MVILSTKLTTAMNIKTTDTNMRIFSINKDFDAVRTTQDQLKIHFIHSPTKQEIPFISHFFVADIRPEFDLILGIPFITSLSPEVYKLEIGNWELKAAPKAKNNLTRILVITEKVFGFGEEYMQYEEKIQLLSETMNSTALQKLFKQYKGIFADSFTSLPAERDIEHTIQLIDNPTFHKKPVFRLSEEKNKYMKMLINDLLDIGLI